MSINRAIGNAFSGLAAQSRAAELVSRNLSNASVDGYHARQATLVHQVYGDQGGGVKISAVTRAGDPMLTMSRRVASGETALQQGAAGSMRALADLLGIEGVEEGLVARYADLEKALTALADTPESATVQRSAAEAASMLARSMNVISTDARRLRVAADTDIARQVDTVNDALSKIERLNKEIQGAASAGRDVTGLEDERDRLIEVVNGIVPIRAKPTHDGGVELRSASGTLLVGHKAWPLSFTPTPSFDESTTYPGGLGAVRAMGADGQPEGPDLSPSGGSAALRGGSLEAAFRMRDETAPKFLKQLNAMAADLIVRFQGEAADPTNTAGAPGLFTNAGAAFDPLVKEPPLENAKTEGLAFDLRVNEIVAADPGVLQKGLYAADAPASGDATVALGLLDAFRNPADRTDWLQAITDNLPANSGAREMATAFSASRQSMARGAETEAAYRIGLSEALRENELEASAVDTDAELRELLAIEKAYAANARVLSTVDEMMRVILEI
ncbi:MAG: flagellar hook-associated protein FlgK [Rubrimonas sp.]|uniref:flagellar hook-associated protein FlgK n=1 Tax=Rubrimonas sp. TaxID=2036015 RepID=UPI002FDE19A5